MQGLVREQQRVESVMPGSVSDDGLIKVACRWEFGANSALPGSMSHYCLLVHMHYAHAVEQQAAQWLLLCMFVQKFVCFHRALEDRMREYDMFDLRPFYLSKEFQHAQFQLDQGAGLISVRRT